MASKIQKVRKDVQERVNKTLDANGDLLDTLQKFSGTEERQEALNYVARLAWGGGGALPPLTPEEGKEIVKQYLGEKHALSLYVTQDEEEELEKQGYKPNTCVLIKRVRGRGSVFICVPKIIGPIIVPWEK